VVSAGSYAAVCIDAADVALTGTPAGGTFSGTGVTGDSFDPNSGTQTITYSFTNASGCSSTNTSTIAVNSLPTINAGTNQIICFGAGAVLQGTGGVSYTWNNGVTNNQSFNPPLGTTTYTVVGIDANGCMNTDVVEITAIAPPTVVISSNVNSGVPPLEVIFQNTSVNATNYVWTFGNGTGATTNQTDAQTVIYEDEGLYTVTLIASNSACSNQVSIDINVIVSLPAIVEAPNVFSPNGDNVNDVFFLKMTNIAKISVQLFNRWGELVHEMYELTDVWAGETTSGLELNDGVYFYKYEATGLDNGIITGHGHVTLIR